MRAITNQTRKPHWDAHGRLIEPGGIIGFEHSLEEHEALVGDEQSNDAGAPQPETKPAKGSK